MSATDSNFSSTPHLSFEYPFFPRGIGMRGENAVVNGVEYQNVEAFLKSKNA